MGTNFINSLKEKGWTEVREDWEYRKGDWFILRDTSSWWMLGTINNPRLFDIPEFIGIERWATSLIEHLCKCDDDLHHFRNQHAN